MTDEDRQEKTKLGICVPWDSPFVWTAPMFNMLNWERPDDCDVHFFMGAGWCPAARHNDAVAKALAWGADLVMFNGGDHLCPFDILSRMLARIREGWDMVHAMAPGRGVVALEYTPFKAVSYKMIGPLPRNDTVLNCDPKSVKVISTDDEPQQTHISGTGNILMKAAIFAGLQKPYFEEFIKKDGRYSRYCVQDSHFVFRCTVESGARMLCDPTIEIIHLDVFGIDRTYSERFKDKGGDPDWSPARDLRKYV
jgi:hypothetical protein